MCHVELSYCILLGKTRREWLGSAGFFSLKRDEKQSLIITCPVVTVLWEQEGWALCFFGEAHEAVQWQKHMQLPERMQVLQKGDWFPSVVVTLHLLHAGVNDNTRQRHTTCNHRPYCTLFGQDSSQRNFPFFCQHELASQIFILALKSLTSGPTEKLPFFFSMLFQQVMLNCITEGTLSKVVIEMGKESKNDCKEKGQIPPEAREVVKYCPISCRAGWVTLSLRRFRQLKEMQSKHRKSLKLEKWICLFSKQVNITCIHRTSCLRLGFPLHNGVLSRKNFP